MPKKMKVHWAGGLIYDTATSTVHCCAGWAVCCSGDRAEEIAATPGAQTSKLDEVTCGQCLIRLRKGGLIDPEPDPEPELVH